MLTLPTYAADTLAAFFASAESDAGMRSTFGAFVALAQSGVRTDGGRRDPEINVTEERFGWPGRREDGTGGPGEEYPCRVSRSRAVWKALRLLSGDAQNVLYAAHGPTDWAKLVDASFGRGTATKLTKLVGPNLGVALLTPTVAKGLAEALAKAEEPTKRVVERTALWNTTGGWLVATARVEGKGNASPLCSLVSREAARLLLDAHTAYAAACCASGRAVYLVDASSEQARRKAPRARERTRQEKVTGAEVAAWG